MNQLKRWYSLQRKGFGHDRASVAPCVWDSVVGHWDSMDRKMVVFQSLTTPGGIRLPSCQDNTKSVRTSSFICCSCYDKVGGVMSKMPEKWLAKWSQMLAPPSPPSRVLDRAD